MTIALLERPWKDPVEAMSAFAEEPFALALLGDGGAGGWSYLALRPERTLLAGPDHPDPFTALAGMIGRPGPRHPDGPPFQGGAAGLAAYELGARAEGQALARTDWPDLACGRYTRLLAFDGERRRVLAVGPDEAGAAEAGSWLDTPPHRPSAGVLAEDFGGEDPDAYERAVAEVVARIGAGEIFQANIARRWRGRLAKRARPFDLFARLAKDSPAPFAAYLRLPGRAVVSNSPERFIRLDSDRRASSEPIKGTRPRGTDAATDAANAAALLASAKDRAENLMIVDLMRNDLSRVCDGVRAHDLFALKTFPNVHHLVSTVSGDLRAGLGAADLLRAAFPPGSITGAPKVQAMTVIAGLEPPRGPFFGSVFWAGTDGGMDSSVLIRTAAFTEQDGGWAFEARAGAGIVADSNPAEERRETEAKIGALRRALTEPER